MAKRIVIALGGNVWAKIRRADAAVKTTASAIEISISRGRHRARRLARRSAYDQNVCRWSQAAGQERHHALFPCGAVAMSQGYIGYDLRQNMSASLTAAVKHPLRDCLTQVDPPRFQHPTKPIGAFKTEEEPKARRRWHRSRRGRRPAGVVVASPRPKEIG